MSSSIGILMFLIFFLGDSSIQGGNVWFIQEIAKIRVNLLDVENQDKSTKALFS